MRFFLDWFSHQPSWVAPAESKPCYVSTRVKVYGRKQSGKMKGQPSEHMCGVLLCAIILFKKTDDICWQWFEGLLILPRLVVLLKLLVFLYQINIYGAPPYFPLTASAFYVLYLQETGIARPGWIAWARFFHKSTRIYCNLLIVAFLKQCARNINISPIFFQCRLKVTTQGKENMSLELHFNICCGHSIGSPHYATCLS